MDTTPKAAPHESKDGYYEVYYTPEGKKIIVLEGLSIQDQQNPPELQLFIREHYSIMSTLYWVLLCVVLVYLVGTHLFIPISEKIAVKMNHVLKGIRVK